MRIPEQEKALEWCAGNVVAAQMLGIIFEASQLADDFADGDVQEGERSHAMTRLLHLLMVDLQENPFFCMYRVYLIPLFSTSLMYWNATNEWAMSDRHETRLFGFAYREVLEQVMYFTARICGGFEHAVNVVRDAQNYYRGEDSETYEEWVGKTQGGKNNG